jgi:D-3-phosphoglycerate dehydrogenase
MTDGRKYKVLICDGMVPEGLAVFRANESIEVLDKKGISREDLLKIIPECEAVIVRSATTIDSEVIETGTKLKVIARAGVGLDNVDIPAATKRGIVAMNTPTGNTTSAAEHTMALMLSMLRNIPQADAKMRSGGWDRNKYTGREAFGKTLGVIGLGKIGRQVAQRSQAFEMKIVGYDPFASKESAEKDGIELVTLDELYERADIVTLHVPKTEDTKGMINKKTLAKMKKGAFLVNCARGPLIVDQDLVDAIDSGHLSGAAIDVYHEEPPQNSPLVGHPKVITTPHLGASTEEAQINVGIMIAEQVVDALEDREVRNAANMPRLDPETKKNVGPFIRLADELGQFCAQLIKGSVEKIEVHCQGNITRYDVSPITVGALRGAMSTVMPDTVNFVNAQFLAEMQGLKVESSSSSEATGFTNLVTVTLTAAEQVLSASGTIFEGQEVSRIVGVDDYVIEARPYGNILAVRNKDQPGVVGLVGTVLAKNGINISDMSLGSNKAKKISLEIINVDRPVPTEVVEELKSNELILAARAITIR